VSGGHDELEALLRALCQKMMGYTKLLSLYPAGHSRPAKALESACEALQRALREVAPLSIWVHRGKLYSDRFPVSKKDATLDSLAKDLTTRSVKCLSFTEGAGHAEIGAAARFLRTSVEEIERNGGPRSFVKSLEAPCLHVAEYSFAGVGESPSTNDDPSDLVRQHTQAAVGIEQPAGAGASGQFQTQAKAALADPEILARCRHLREVLSRVDMQQGPSCNLADIFRAVVSSAQAAAPDKDPKEVISSLIEAVSAKLDAAFERSDPAAIMAEVSRTMNSKEGLFEWLSSPDAEGPTVGSGPLTFLRSIFPRRDLEEDLTRRDDGIAKEYEALKADARAASEQGGVGEGARDASRVPGSVEGSDGFDPGKVRTAFAGLPKLTGDLELIPAASRDQMYVGVMLHYLTGQDTSVRESSMARLSELWLGDGDQSQGCKSVLERIETIAGTPSETLVNGLAWLAIDPGVFACALDLAASGSDLWLKVLQVASRRFVATTAALLAEAIITDPHLWQEERLAEVIEPCRMALPPHLAERLVPLARERILAFAKAIPRDHAVRVVRCLAFGKTPQARLKALAVAGEFGSPCIASMLALVGDPDGRVRHQAIWRLGEMDDPRATDRLRQLVADESAPMEDRKLALTGLAADGKPDTRKFLKRLCRCLIWRPKQWALRRSIAGLLKRSSQKRGRN